MHKNLIIIALSLCLLGCVTANNATYPEAADLARGKQYFERGYYKRAFAYLSNPAYAGDPQAAYAIGYMYYYGYGTAQNTQQGYIWIKRSADQGYPPAIQALNIIARNRNRK